jgi:hypothetical protein
MEIGKDVRITNSHRLLYLNYSRSCFVSARIGIIDFAGLCWTRKCLFVNPQEGAMTIKVGHFGPMACYKTCYVVESSGETAHN